MRRRLAVSGLLVSGLVAAGSFAPLFGPDARLDSHLPPQEDLARPGSVDSGAPGSPYGRLHSVEVRKRERRSLIDVALDRASAIVVLRTERSVVVERVSSTTLDLARWAVLSHTELSPDDVPSGVLTAAEQVEHREAFRLRGDALVRYTTGGYDG